MNPSKTLTKDEQLSEDQRYIFHKVMDAAESISVQGYNENHEVIYWNRASEAIYGYTKAEAIGKKLEDLIIPAEARDFVRDSINNWIHKGVAIPSSELVLTDKYGNEVNVFSQHVMIKDNSNKSEMYCLDINLKEIKQLQQKLTLEKNFLNAIFDVIPDLVWLKDTDGVYLKCNRRFEQFFGAEESEIINKTDFDFVDKELAQFFRDHDNLAIKAGKPTINEEYLTFADGSHEGIFETIKTPMKDENGDVIGVLGVARDISERKAREKELENYANYDSLTGLTNRTVFMDRLKQLLNQRETKKVYHAVLFVDLDKFKEINDTVGHSVGDEVLVMVAARLKKLIRKGDTVSRLGGDEFTILLENIQDPIKAINIAQKVLDSIREPFIVDENKFFITSSIGISISPDDSNSAVDLIKFADKAMYRAKGSGKDTYKFYTEEPQ